MKKGCLGCLGVFSILGVFSGTITIITGQSDNVFTDILLLFIFIALGIISFYYLNNKKSRKIPQHHKENTVTQNVKKHENEENSPQNQDTDSDRLQKENEILKMKLDLKEQYIKEIEQQSKKETDTTPIDSIKGNINGDYFNPRFGVQKSSTDKGDDINLTYTKARKLTDTFVVLDFETTGLKHKENDIIQYGAIEYKNSKIMNEKNEYFKPSKPVSKRIEKITGITNEFLEDKPRLSKGHLEELYDFLKGKTIVAHNAPFDMKFLLYQFHINDIQHEKFRVIDTLTFSKRLIHETPNHKLQTLKEHFNLDDGESHNAINDCRATGNLVLLLLDRINKI